MPIFIDGKEVDLARPETLGAGIQILPQGYIRTVEDGVETILKNELPKKEEEERPN